MSPVADNPVIVPDCDLGQERKPGESEPPRIRCPLCGWVATKGRQMVLHLRNRMEYFRYGRRVPSLPPSMD